MNTASTTDDDAPPHLNHRTTFAILSRAAATSLSLVPTLLTLSLLLLSFRTLVETGTLSLTSFIDHNPSLRSLLSHFHLTTATTATHNATAFLSSTPRHRPHRPFLHLTRVGTLDDDFFSSDDVILGPRPTHNLNSTAIPLSLLDPSLLSHRFSFKIEETTDENLQTLENITNSTNLIDLGRRETAVLFFLVSVLSAAYGWVILGFVVAYSWALGIVFVSVVFNLLGRRDGGSVFEILWAGSNLGVKRLSGFVLMRWAVRDALTQVVGLWFFGEVEDQYSFFRLFLRLKLMPFSVSLPWVEGFEKEVSGFLFAWLLVDSVVGFVFAVDSWVTIVNTRRGGREIVKEGCYLLFTMIHQSIQIKCLELILCGAFTRWVLRRMFGRSVAVLVQSLIEVYFMVVWLIFYFAARCRDASLSGRRFGRRELEGLVEGLR